MDKKIIKSRTPKPTKKMLAKLAKQPHHKFQPKVKIGNIIEPKEEKILIQLTAELLKSNNTVRHAFREIMKGQAKVSTLLKEYIVYKFKKEESKVKKFDKGVKDAVEAEEKAISEDLTKRLKKELKKP